MPTFIGTKIPLYNNNNNNINNNFISDFNFQRLKYCVAGYYYVDSGSSYVSCNDTAFPSFTLVMDTTGSMLSYLNNFQDIVRTFSTRLAASSANVTRQYTLMQFNDPSVGPLKVTCSPTEFLNGLSFLYAHDGGDCPEYAMVGLLKALEVSPFGSFVVLVTDATAKDSGNTDAVSKIFSLLDSLQVKVFLFAGYCGSINNPDFQIYKDIAARSYGHVFSIYNPSTTIADLLNFFLKIPVNSTSRLLSVDNNVNYVASFSVGSNLTSLIVSVSGSINSLIFYNPFGAVENLTVFSSESWGSLSYLDRPSRGIWTVKVYASSSHSLRIEGYNGNSSRGSDWKWSSNTFCSTCNRNATCKKDLVDYTCVCKVGFTGDGFSCYDIDECTQWPYPCSFYGYCVNTYGSFYCNCPPGYTRNGTSCFDINECLEPGLNNCDAHAVCFNTYGSYSCYCPEGYYGDGYTCEINECLEDVCGISRECIKIPGSHICSDPCFNYTTLNEPTRSTSYNNYYYYYGRYDYYLTGWYRFTGSGGTKLAEYCPSVGSCYTRSPMWLKGTHPDPSDGIVNRKICTADNGVCCGWTSEVKIKSCPGGFYIYRFSPPPVIYSGYCTDPATVPDFCSCADNEECRKVNGRYGCYCKDNGGPSALEDIRPVLSCGTQEIKASFQKCDLEKFHLDIKNIHLINRHCTGFADFNTTNIISVVSILKSGVCGNELVNNGKYVVLKNTIFLSLDTNSSFGGADVLAINFSCVYPLDMQLSLDTALKPLANTTTVVMENTGQLQVSMALFQDSNYITPYTGSQVTLTSKSNLYIGILLKISDSSKYAVRMTNCYAAPSINSSTRYDIIKNSCPSKQDSSINVTQNGASVNGQFSLRLFGYVKNLDVVYLYCSIHICDTFCIPICNGARALSAGDSETTDASLYVGPIYLQDDRTVSSPNIGGGASCMVSSLATILLFLSGTMFFTC
ncbi:uromodulin-like [Leptodactylus fuscus]|uniref:uromodulin-like n=1 Tax=Leptodactylus fuscus TaxID=238119 RepID=UPI003F4EDBCA